MILEIFIQNVEPTYALAPLVLGGLIAGAGSLIGGGMSYFGQKSANDTNIKLQQNAQDYERQMWELNNAYNSPYSQMQRYKEAGLNPNLMYGSGNVGNSSAPPSPHVANVVNELSGMAQSVPQVLSMYQDYQMKKAQIQNTTAQNGLIRAQENYTINKALNETIRTGLLGWDEKSKALAFRLSNRLYDTQVDAATEGLSKIRTENSLLMNELEQSNAFKKFGIDKSDNFILKMLFSPAHRKFWKENKKDIFDMSTFSGY